MSSRRLMASVVSAALAALALSGVTAAPANAYDPAVTINASGGSGAGDGLRITTGSGQLQVRRVGVAQLYSPKMQPSGSTAPALFNGVYLLVGATLVGPPTEAFNHAVTGWTAPWTSVTTTGGSAAGSGSAVSTMTYETGGLTYTVTQSLNYTFPNDFVTITLGVEVPAGNTDVVRLYHLADTYLQGTDTGPGYALFPSGDTTGTPYEVGVVKTSPTTVVEAFRSATPTWDGWASQEYRCMYGWGDCWDVGTLSAIVGGPLWRGLAGINPRSSTDNGIGVTWPIPSTAGSTTLAYDLYFTASSLRVPSLAPSVQEVAGQAGEPLATSALTGTNFSGAPVFTVSPALPAGLSLDTASGSISGTPSSGLPLTTYTIRGTYGQEQASALVRLTVDAPTPAPVSIAPDEQSLAGIVGAAVDPTTAFTAYDFTGPVTYSVSPALPAGLSIDASTGIVSGTPTGVAAASWYTVTASGGGRSAQGLIEITVDPAPPVPLDLAPSTQSLSGQAGKLFEPSTPYTATGFDVAPDYSVAPALPAGLVLDPSTGTITGTPTAQAAGRWYTVTATAKEQSATAEVWIAVDPADPAPVSISPASQTITGVVGTAIIPTTQMSHYGFTGPVTYSVRPSLPSGLRLNPTTGVVSGKPGAAASGTWTIKGSDGTHTDAASLVLRISKPRCR